MGVYIVPILLFMSSFLMAFAWLGHIKFKDKPFSTALTLSWFLVLPEYLLNVFAMRWGVEFYKPSEMASINLCTGVICVAIVSKYFLGETLDTSKTLGFILMSVGMVLVVL